MSRDPAPAGRGAAIGLGAILAATALLRLRLLGVPLERDEGEYAYMGQLILAGAVPYVDAHNMKLPGVYYAYAAILGVLGETDVAIRVALLLVNAASIALLYVLGRRLLDPAAGLGAAAAYAALSLSASVAGYTANAEHFVVLPMLAGALLLARPAGPGDLARVAAAGGLLGLAVVMKQHGLAFVLFGGVALLVQRRRPGAHLVFAAAAAAPLAGVCLGMALAGAFAPFWFWTVTYAGTYATMITPAMGLGFLAREIARIGTASVALWALAAIGLTALAWDRSLRRPAAFLLPFALCSALAVVPGLRFSDHYFILLLPAASLLVAGGAGALARAARRPALALTLSLGAVLLSLAQEHAYLLAPSPRAVARAVYGANPFPEAVEIARYLRDHTAPDERVAVIGSEPEIYFYARRRAATSYLYVYEMMAPQPFARAMQDEMIAQLERARPRYLVLVNVDSSWSRRADSDPRLLAWAERVVAEAYEPVGLAEILPGGETRYRWDGEARDAVPASPHYVATFRRRS